MVWEWSWYGRGASDVASRPRQRLEHDLAALSQHVFGTAFAPYDLELLARDLCGPTLLAAVGFPLGPVRCPASVDTRLGRLAFYLTDPELFVRGRAIMWISPEAEGASLVRVQAGLRRKVGARGITVEVNPTSKLLIGDFEDLTSHPLWRLRPPRSGASDVPPVSVCAAADSKSPGHGKGVQPVNVANGGRRCRLSFAKLMSLPLYG
jgi:hypothetical protein